MYGELVWVAGRVYEHQPTHFGRERGKIEAQAQGQASAERVAQEDYVLQVQRGDKGREVANLHVWRVALVRRMCGKSRLAAVPVADQVGCDDAVAGQACSQAEPRGLVVKDAVQQHQRGGNPRRSHCRDTPFRLGRRGQGGIRQSRGREARIERKWAA